MSPADDTGRAAGPGGLHATNVALQVQRSSQVPTWNSH